MTRRLAIVVAELAARLLPSPTRAWGLAMTREAASIDHAGAALRFALGCLGCALREAALFQLLRPVRGAQSSSSETPDVIDALRLHPRALTGLCAVIATGLGLAYLTFAGAPAFYLVGNAVALVLGFLIVGLLMATGGVGERTLGTVAVALGALLVATALFGTHADGATRWFTLFGVSTQPSLMLVPPLVMIFARTRGTLATCGMALAALALAMQPDRAMAAALTAAAGALALVRPDRRTLTVLALAVVGLATTVLRPDALPAVPFVDRVFYTAFAAHPLAGIAVFAGVVVMMVPPVAGWTSDPANRPVHAAFGALWLVIIAAAALGNYPTPVVGYGASAIVGYVVALLGLPRRSSAAITRPSAVGEKTVRQDGDLRAGAAVAG